MDKHALAIATFGLTKEFGSRRAVDNMNLAIAPGGVFGFLGPNGAGKTTTIRMLLGLIRPTGGSGSILGYDIVAERAKILPHVGAIVESPAFYPYLSGRDNLRVLARTAGGEDSRRIAEVLDTVDLGGRAGDKVKTYSLGMKQRLAIAAALLNNPRIIFLDEPTNGLDPAGTVEIRDLIRRLGASGHTIFLSSHLLHEVEQIATEVAIIDKGKLVMQGYVAELTRQGAALLVEADPLPIVRQVAERMGATSEQRGPRLAELRLAPERAPDLVAALVQAGAQVFQVTPQRSSLEQLFLSLTGSEKQPASSHQLSAVSGQPAVAGSQ
jgi:ABC-2 type transport system ATP-binding protein